MGLHLAAVDEDGRAAALIGETSVADARVLIVNDIITTGHGVKALADVIARAGGLTIGCCAFLARTAGAPEQAVAMPSAVTASAPLPAWSPAHCPLCGGDEPPEDARDLN